VEEEFPWFRGSNIEDDLMPCLYRESAYKNGKPTDKQIINNAEDIREEFRRRGEYLLTESHRKLEDGELYVLMQHYAVPTRLLDWTESLFIALYFAIRKQIFGESEKSSKPIHVPCVWMLNPSWLNHKSIKTSLPVYLIESAWENYKNTDKKAGPYLKEKKLPPYPIAIYPHYHDSKMLAQKSVFTMHGKIHNAFSIMCSSNSKAQICGIKINPEKITNICKELRLAGITETTIFPEPKSIANEIRSEKNMWFSFDR
jgi:hypothetical protein